MGRYGLTGMSYIKILYIHISIKYKKGRIRVVPEFPTIAKIWNFPDIFN
jgi:hypothetical protein